MGMLFRSHGGVEPTEETDGARKAARGARAAPAAPGDISVDEVADFGYLYPPSGNADDYLPEAASTVADLDQLGNLMIDQAGAGNVDATPDSSMPAVMTYWGQFLDHELTARTDRESTLTTILSDTPTSTAQVLESDLKNARSPRFDLDSVYGGVPVGATLTPDTPTLISGLRHPTLTEKMRVGTADSAAGPIPDGLDPHRDLPRYTQVQPEVREASLRLAQASMSAADFIKFEANLDGRALIGDMRNDENLIIAQFHTSFLRFHNKAVDFLAANNTGWIADYTSARELTRLHYQWLAIEGYLKTVCDPAVVQSVIDDRASHFSKFRSEHQLRNPSKHLGNAMPMEFSVAAFRFGHTMVRNIYDYNPSFGRSPTAFLPNAPFELIFGFTGGGGMRPNDQVPLGTTLPENWIIDWARFVGGSNPDLSDGGPAHTARKIDTELAPPLGTMINEANEEADAAVKELFKHLARRNLRRGYDMHLPTGQALHKYLKDNGAVNSDPIADVGSLFAGKQALVDFLQNCGSKFHQKTPLWFYLLAEAEAGGGESLGEVGSWIVASTFVGVMLADPDSALSRNFTPNGSPLRGADDTPIDSIEKWMRFAAVLEQPGMS